jgi:hypothetical protein
VTYEIIVFSQEKVEGSNIIWVPEIDKKGPIYGFNKMCEISTGEYIVCLTDDHVLTNSIKLSLDDLDSKKFDSDMIISSLNPNDGGCFNPIRGQILGDSVIDQDIPKYPLVRFPIVHRKSLSLLDGVIFNESLYYHAGDIWLGFYVGYKYAPSFDGPTQIKSHNPQKNESYEVQDCNRVRELIFKLIKDSNTKYSDVFI